MLLLAHRKWLQKQLYRKLVLVGIIWSYDQALQRNLQMKLLISQRLSFNHFDNDGMTNYIHHGLQPKYQKVSRITIRRDVIKGYMLVKKFTLKAFKNYEGKVSLTSDVWTAGQNYTFSLCKLHDIGLISKLGQ